VCKGTDQPFRRKNWDLESADLKTARTLDGDQAGRSLISRMPSIVSLSPARRRTRREARIDVKRVDFASKDFRYRRSEQRQMLSVAHSKGGARCPKVSNMISLELIWQGVESETTLDLQGFFMS